MQFSNTSTRQGLIQDCEFLTNIGDTGISGSTEKLAHFTRLINDYCHRVVTIILTSQDEWQFDDNNNSDFPILTANLVANQRDFLLPISDKLMKIQRLEVSYDGVNWVKAEPIDFAEVGRTINDSSTDGNFSQAQPFYDVFANSLFIYPKAPTTVTGGMKMWIQRDIDEFVVADTTQEPSFDRAFHRYLSLGASYDWAWAKGLNQANAIKNELLEMEAKVRQFYGKKQEDRQMQLKPAYVNYN